MLSGLPRSAVSGCEEMVSGSLRGVEEARMMNRNLAVLPRFPENRMEQIGKEGAG